MKKQIPLIVFICLCLFFIVSCRKNFAEEQYTETIQDNTPDFTRKVNAGISGYVVDENNDPVAGVVVTAGSKSIITDEYGYFRIPNTELTQNIGFITLDKAGYYKNYKTFIPREGEETFLRAKILAKTETGNVSGTAGGTVSAADGATVNFPAGATVVAATGVPYTGNIHAFIRSVNPVAGDFMTSMPGDGRGTDKDGYLRSLQSNATIAVELAGDAGERLQIAAGKSATVTIPITTALIGSSPATISLWSLDETTGLWKQESSATKNGSNYTGTVTHFSFWDGAIGLPVVNVTTQVVNDALQPLANVPVMITPEGVPWNAGFGVFGFTDANGFVNGAVPANAGLTLDVVTTCFTSAYSHNFHTNGSDLDLGTIKGNLGQNTVTLTGTVVNCSNQPVTNGYVQTYDNGFYNRINITNGSFSFTGISCTNTTVNYVAVDNDTHQQNSPVSLTLTAGSNNLGAVTACGLNTYSTLAYTINGTDYILGEPVDTLYGFFSNGYTTVVKLVTGQPSPPISFQFSGGFTLGSDHQLFDIWSPQFASGRAYSPLPGGLKVTITEYGKVGGFISGNFSGLMLDFVSNEVYNVSYNFRIKRHN